MVWLAWVCVGCGIAQRVSEAEEFVACRPSVVGLAFFLVDSVFSKSCEDLGVFFCALACVSGLLAYVWGFWCACVLDDAVGVMEVEGQVGIAGDGPLFVVE